MNINDFFKRFHELKVHFGLLINEEDEITKSAGYYDVLSRYPDEAIIKAFGIIKSDFIATEFNKFPQAHDFKNIIAVDAELNKECSRTQKELASKSDATWKEKEWYFNIINIIKAMHIERLRYGDIQLGQIMSGEMSPILKEILKNQKRFLAAAMDNKPEALARYYWEWFKVLRETYKDQTGNTFELTNKSVVDSINVDF